MSQGEVSLLDLPSVRGNPFDNRPIEASRAHDLVGRKEILHRWRDHIHSGSPRMILLVGESGSGRTSMINTISSQTQKKYIGQYLSEGDDQVRTVLHEIVTHFGSFQSIPTMNQLSQKLISIFDEEKGPLPLIALDYPSQVIDINQFLSRISPILSRLRAMILVSLTESQFLDLDNEIIDIFDEPDRISNFTKSEIQEMVNNRMRLKSKEKWNINPQILESIHSSTGGNPRDVLRILKRLVDEKRDLGYHGTLESLMSWQNHSFSSGLEEDNNDYNRIEEKEEPTVSPIPIEEFSNQEILESDEDESFSDMEPSDLWEEDEEDEEEDEDPNWSNDFSVSEDNWFDNEDSESENEDRRLESISDSEPEVYEPVSELIESTKLFMEPGTEPPKGIPPSEPFGGLRARLADTSSKMKNDEFNHVPVIDADNSQPTLHKFVNQERESKSNVSLRDTSIINSEAVVDKNIETSNYDEVIITEGSEWSVEPSFSSTLPDIPIKSEPAIIEPLSYEVIESYEPILDEEQYIEENEIQKQINPPISIPSNTISSPPLNNLVPKIPDFSPTWEPDLPLDKNRFYSLSDAERLILQISAEREISPSDNELQARLEVGRPRLSQLYNGLHKSGMLSVRKQGRTRLFKLSNAAAEEF